MLALVFGALAVGVYNEPAPTSPPPAVLIGTVKGEAFVSKIAQIVPVPVTVVEKQVQGDKVVDVTITKYVTKTRQIEVKRDLKKATFHTAGGKKLSLEDVQKRLAKSEAVVLSTDGYAIPEVYLKAFDKDVVVIVAPLPPSVAPLPKKE